MGGLLLHIQGYKLINYTEIIATDHLGIIVDIDLNAYFNMRTFVFDKRETCRLDLRQRKHCEGFCNKTEELFNTVNIERRIDDIKEEHAPNFLIEAFDKELTYIVYVACRYACRRGKNIANDEEKLKLMSAKYY